MIILKKTMEQSTYRKKQTEKIVEHARELRALGMSYREIGAVIGKTGARIHQMIGKSYPQDNT